jgi:hypothetical protein
MYLNDYPDNLSEIRYIVYLFSATSKLIITKVTKENIMLDQKKAELNGFIKVADIAKSRTNDIRNCINKQDKCDIGKDMCSL